MTEKFKQKVKTFWDEADKDGSKGLNLEELKVIIRKVSAVAVSDSEVENMFKDVDKDNNKTISWEEFQSIVDKKDNAVDITRRELEAAFREADKDGSGKLERSEVKAMVNALGVEISDADLDMSMKAADPNGDGVDINEYIAAWNRA